MQKLICGDCNRVFLVDRDDPNSSALKEAMEHAEAHAQNNEYAKFKTQLGRKLLSNPMICSN